MHLVLGHPDDPCCSNVRDVLEARGYPTQVIDNPLGPPSRFAWRIDSEQSASRLSWRDDLPVQDDEIACVLVRSTGWIDPSGWESGDLAYMQSETQAALLAWLWSLRCPVVNRFPSVLWYRPQVPLLFWQPLLRRCGLRSLETLVTNVEQEARAFGQRLAQEGVGGAVYGPFTCDARYLLTSEQDWCGLAAMQNQAPVGLTHPHGAVQLACVVGEGVIWESKPSAEIGAFEPALLQFARAAGLATVEVALAPTALGIRVVAVESQPNLQHFGDSTRTRIVDGIADLLTEEANTRFNRAIPVLERTLR